MSMSLIYKSLRYSSPRFEFQNKVYSFLSFKLDLLILRFTLLPNITGKQIVRLESILPTEQMDNQNPPTSLQIPKILQEFSILLSWALFTLELHSLSLPIIGGSRAMLPATPQALHLLRTHHNCSCFS